mgnify:CR=1 FL=1
MKGADAAIRDSYVPWCVFSVPFCLKAEGIFIVPKVKKEK